MFSMRVLLTILMLHFISPAGQGENNGIVIIVNSNNTTASLSKSEVKLTYLRKVRKRWPEINKNIVPVDRKDMSESKKIFLSKLLNMTEQDMNRYFTEREYMNAEMPPLSFSSDAEIIDYVANNIGAIGYVMGSSITGENKGKIKIIYP